MPDSPARADRIRRLVEEALPVARARAQLVDDIRAALEQGDERTALLLTRQLCGLAPLERAS